MAAKGELRLIANQPRRCDNAEYAYREQEQREDNNIPSEEPIVFLEIYVRDPSEFSADLNIHGVKVGRHRVLRGESTAVANAIAAFPLHLRDEKGPKLQKSGGGKQHPGPPKVGRRLEGRILSYRGDVIGLRVS